jgi:cytochrome b561
MTETYRYTAAQRALHWAMALIIFLAIALGAYAATLPSGPDSARGSLLFAHKSLGMLALAPLVVRLAVRLARGAPAWRVALSPAVKGASHAAHWGLYVLMLAMPVSGYVLSGAGGKSIPFFGLFEWPVLVAKDKALSESADAAHYWLAWTMGAILAAHVAAALWHHFVRRDETMARMR